MRAFKAYINGFGKAINAIGGVGIYYLALLITTGFLFFPLKSVLLNISPYTLLTEELSGEFIHLNFFVDAMNNYPGTFSFIGKLALVIALSWAILNSFFYGGLIWRLKEKGLGFSPRIFFQKSAHMFWKYLVVAIITLVLIAVLLLICVLPVIIYTTGEGMNNETGLMQLAKIMSMVFVALLLIVLMVADFSRIWLFSKPDGNVFKAVGKAFQATFRYFLNNYLLMILMLANLIVLFFVIQWVGKLSFMKTGQMVFLIFLIQQIFVFIRLFTRIWRLGSLISISEPKQDPTSILFDPK